MFQKDLIGLLLEVVVMIFSTCGEQDSNDLKSTAIKVVSQLAQIPSTAAYFKDVLVMMPITRRQQLQDIIRASVTQDQNPSHVKSSGLSLPIKLPALSQKSKTQDFPPTASTKESGNIDKENDSPPPAPIKESSDIVKESDAPPSELTKGPGEISEEEEEDDWDNFQSFPASTSESGPLSHMPKEESNLVQSPSSLNEENTSNDDERGSSSLPLAVEENLTIADQMPCEGEQNDESTDQILGPRKFHSELPDAPHEERSDMPVSQNENQSSPQDSNTEPLDALHVERSDLVISQNEDQSLHQDLNMECLDAIHAERVNTVVSQNEDQSSPEVHFSKEHSKNAETCDKIFESIPVLKQSQSSMDSTHVNSVQNLTDSHDNSVTSEGKQTLSEHHVAIPGENSASSKSSELQEMKTPDSGDIEASYDRQSVKDANP